MKPPLSKPLLLYDGDCAFCRLWIKRWESTTKDKVDYLPFQEVASSFPDIPPENFRKSVQLNAPDGKVWRGACAVLRTLQYGSGSSVALWLYERIPGFAPLTESAYRFVASHRSGLYTLTKALWGTDLQPSTYTLVRREYRGWTCYRVP